MTSEIIKRMFDACYQAKRTRDMLPPLPEGVRASFIQYLDVIQSLERKGIQVKVSDLSDAMELPRPGVTRTVKEMEEKGYLQKIASEEDGRVTYISITDEGRRLSHTLLLRKKAQNCHRNMTNNILTACFHIWKKYRTKMQNA